MPFDQPPQFNKLPSNTLGSGIPKETSLSSEQKSAIKFSADTGRLIQQACPGIAIDYTNGASLFELVEKYAIQARFGLTNPQTARMAVMNALKGYSGASSDSYSGLITDPKMLEMIGVEHRKDSGKRTGKITRDKGHGIFAMTLEEKKKIGSKVGKNAFDAKIGIHAPGYKAPLLSFETRSENGKKAAFTRGFAVLSREAENFIKGLDFSSEKYQNRRTKVVRVNLKNIADEVNKKFYEGKNVISADAVHSFIRRIKKQKPLEI